MEREVLTQQWLSKEWQLSRGAGGRGVSHPLQLTTGLVVNSFVITSPTFGRWAYASHSEGKYSVGTKIYLLNIKVS